MSPSALRTAIGLAVLALGCGEPAPAAKDTAEVGAAAFGFADTAIAETGTDAEAVAAAEPDAVAPVIDTGIEVTLPGTKDGCTAQCQDKVCGSNGCGSVCGFCKTGFLCKPDGSACTEFCKPLCSDKASGTDKKCGDNGCGGSCGDCGDGFHCGIDFLCHTDDCNGSCAGKTCGDDGCGKSCGDCGAGDLCQSGKCKPGPCKGIPKIGVCQGDLLASCIDPGPSESKQVVDCGAKPGKTCGFDPNAGSNGCVDPPPCEPSCKDKAGGIKECGSDGCKGTCGVCPTGWSCPGGTCKPEPGGACSSFPSTGACYGDVWMFCNTGNLAQKDCKTIDMTCGWTGSKFECIP